jgi:titin
VSNVTENTADISWKAPDSDGGSPITSYLVEFRPSTRTTWMKAGTVDGNTMTLTAPDLLTGNEYLFRVFAVNEEGQSAPLEGIDTAKPVKKICKCFIN